jgi:DNA-binding MurR/RpiR family transcriptional regulator
MNIEHLCDKYQLDPLEKNILIYLFEHIDTLKKIGIRKVANDNKTSTATIIKLSKKLGFEGYADMIYNIIFSWEDDEMVHSLDIFPKINSQFENNKDSFNELISKYKDKQLITAGMGFSQLIANYMNESFLINGFTCISNIHLQLHAKTFKDKVLLIIISESGDTPRFVEMVKNANQNGIEIISFIGNANSPLIQYSTLPIVINRYDKLKQLKHAPNTFFGEAILLFEHLFSYNLNSGQND